MSHLGWMYDEAEKRAAQRFKAKYPGECVNCGDRIEVDDVLRWQDNLAVHAACPDPDEVEAAGEICPRCFTVSAVNGACACDPE